MKKLKINDNWSIESDDRNSKTSISECCHKKQKTSGGYIWRYK